MGIGLCYEVELATHAKNAAQKNGYYALPLPNGKKSGCIFLPCVGRCCSKQQLKGMIRINWNNTIWTHMSCKVDLEEGNAIDCF